jgi:hypothetical protein
MGTCCLHLQGRIRSQQRNEHEESSNQGSAFNRLFGITSQKIVLFIRQEEGRAHASPDRGHEIRIETQLSRLFTFTDRTSMEVGCKFCTFHSAALFYLSVISDWHYNVIVQCC